MTRCAVVLFVLVVLAGCAANDSARDLAVTSCRNGGFLGAIADAGAWYCYKGPALTLPAAPK